MLELKEWLEVTVAMHSLLMEDMPCRAMAIVMVTDKLPKHTEELLMAKLNTLNLV